MSLLDSSLVNCFLHGHGRGGNATGYRDTVVDWKRYLVRSERFVWAYPASGDCSIAARASKWRLLSIGKRLAGIAFVLLELRLVSYSLLLSK